jgi:Domain of unknown function (DUF397)
MDALNWRKASYSASNGGCVEVGGGPGAVLVRDTQDRTGSVLTFSPDAWRRFADQVKRSLAPEPYGVRGCPAAIGALSVSGAPSVRAVVFLAGWCGPRPGCRQRQDLFSVCALVGVVCESAVVRAARPRADGGGRGSGFPRCLELPPAERHGTVCAYCRAARHPGHFPRSPALSCLHFPRSFVRRPARTAFACTFLGHWCGGVPVSAVLDWPPWCLVLAE